MAITDDQAKLIQQASEAAATAGRRAEVCAAAGCLVLAREWDYIAKSLARGVDWQRRALDGEFFRDWKGATDGQASNTGT